METKVIISAGIIILVLVVLVGGYLWVTKNDKKKPNKPSGGGTIGEGFTGRPQE